MNTRPQEALPYRDLARQRARIVRQVGLDEFGRVCEIAVSGLIPEEAARLSIGLTFDPTAAGWVRVTGSISGQIGLTCHGCAEELVHALDIPLDCIIVETEAMADRVVAEAEATGSTEDVIIAGGTEITVAQIVEDEILLSLPERLCLTEPCDWAPGLAYPAGMEAGPRSEEAAAATAAGTNGDDNPFSVLARLKTTGAPADD